MKSEIKLSVFALFALLILSLTCIASSVADPVGADDSVSGGAETVLKSNPLDQYELKDPIDGVYRVVEKGTENTVTSYEITLNSEGNKITGLNFKDNPTEKIVIFPNYSNVTFTPSDFISYGICGLDCTGITGDNTINSNFSKWNSLKWIKLKYSSVSSNCLAVSAQTFFRDCSTMEYISFTELNSECSFPKFSNKSISFYVNLEFNVDSTQKISLPSNFTFTSSASYDKKVTVRIVGLSASATFNKTSKTLSTFILDTVPTGFTNKFSAAYIKTVYSDSNYGKCGINPKYTYYTDNKFTTEYVGPVLNAEKTSLTGFIGKAETADLGSYNFETVGSGAFSSANVGNIILPSTVKSIEGNTFTSSYIKSVKLHLKNLETLDGTAFSETILELIDLSGNESGKYVLQGSWLFENNDGVTKTLWTGIVTEETVDLSGYNLIECPGFRGSKDVKKAVLPSTIKTIKNSFNGCENLTEVEIRTESDLVVGDKAFYGCTSLKEINLKSAISIGNSAFHRCIALEKVEISSSLDSVGTHAFQDCSKLYYVADSDGKFGPKTIGEGAFEKAASLGLTKDGYTFDLSVGVETIGARAFLGTQLKTVTIPSTVKDIALVYDEGYSNSKYAPSVFSGCINLTQINVGQGNTYFSSVDGLLLDADGKTLLICPEGKTEAVLPDTVTSLKTVNSDKGECARTVFVSSNLKKVDMSKTSITVLNDYEFYNCVGLKEVILSPATTTVSKYAFAECQSLVTVSCKDSKLESVGEYAFFKSGIADIDFPASLETIGSNAFKECLNLRTVTFAEGSKLKTIGSMAFTGCSSLQSLSLPSTLESLWYSDADKSAESSSDKRVSADMGGLFKGCPSLTKITIDSGNTRYTSSADGKVVFGFGYSASEAKKVSDANITNGTTEVYGGTWGVIWISPSATEITIDAKSVFFQKDYDIYTALDDCSSLKSISVDSANTVYSASDGLLLSKDGKILYKVPTAVQDVVIPSTVEQIGDGNSSPFVSSAQINSITWSGNTLTISENAFSKCKSIGSISLTSTGDITFKESEDTYNASFRSIDINCGGKLTAEKNSLNSSYSHSAYIVCKELSMTGMFSENIGSLTVKTDNSPVWKNLFSDNTYGNVSLSLKGAEGEEVTDSVKLLTGYSLKLSDSSSDFGISIVSVSKTGVKFTVESSQGYRWNDLVVKSGETALEFKDGSYSCEMTADVVITVTVKETTEKVKLTLKFGNSIADKEVDIPKGMTLRKEQLTELSKEVSSTGYELYGWYLDDKFSESYTPKSADGDITLYAKWTLTDGYTVTWNSASNSLSAVVDGKYLFNGEKVAKDSKIKFIYSPHSDIELLLWKVDGKEYKTDDAAFKGTELELTVTGNISVSTEERYVSLSNILNGVSTRSVDVGNMVLSWSYKCIIDASMSTWTGFPSEPLIIGDHVYFRTGDHLVKVKISDGTVVKDLEFKNTTAKSFYLYLGYGNGSILDFQTGKAFDLNLEEQWTVPDGIISAFYNGGYFYGITSEGKLYKFNEKGLVGSDGWRDGIDTKWFGLYGGTSAPVFTATHIYFIEASGDERAIAGVNLTTGEKITTDLYSYIAGKYLDNGWLTSYERDGITYLFLTSYSTGLFDGSASKGTNNNAVLVLKVENDGSTALFNRINIEESMGAGSAFITYGNRGYLHFGGTLTGGEGTLFVFDMNKVLENTPGMLITVTKTKEGAVTSSNGALIYCEDSVYTHGSIVLSVGKDGHRTIMLVPYTSGYSAVYFFDDYDGKTAGEGYTALSDRSDQFSSQAVRVGPNGEMIWYTDSGVLKCYASADNVPVSVFIQGKNWTGWVSEQRNVTETDSKLIEILNKYGYTIKGEYAITSEQKGKIVAVIDGKDYVAKIYVKNTDGMWIEVDTVDMIPKLSKEIMVSFDGINIDEIEDDDYLYDAEGKNPVKLIDVIYDSSKTGQYFEFRDVSYDFDGGKGDIIPPGLIERGKTYTITDKKPTKEGYTFAGWMCNGKDVSGTLTVDSSDIIIKAKWDLNVVYNLDGGTGAENGSYPIGTKITLSGKSGEDITVTKSGYVFKGWFDGNTLYNAGDEYIVTAPVEFKAYWVAEGASEGTILEVTDSSGTIVNGQSITLRVDRTMKFSSLIKPVSAAQDVTWSSSAPGIVSVDRGVITAVAPGQATITVKVINGYKDLSTTITVIVPAYSLVLEKTVTEPMTVGESAELKAVYEGGRAVEGLVWSSDNSSIVSVTDGKITATGVGKAVITVTAPNGSKTECTVAVAEQQIDVNCSDINVGASAEPAVKVDGVTVTDGYTFASGSPTVVSVEGKKLKAQSIGVAEITVTYNGSVSKFIVRVNSVLVDEIRLGSTSAEMTAGDVKSLTYTLNPANPTVMTVTWSSSNSAVAAVDQNGNITALSEGKAIITVKSNDAGGKYASCTVTVIKAKPVMESVSIDKTNIALVKDDDTKGKYTPVLTISPADAEFTVVWSSGDASVAAVDSASGIITAKGAGTAVITATVTSGNTVMTVICDVTVTEKPTVTDTKEKSNDDGTKTTEVKESIKTGKDTFGEKTTTTVKDGDGNTKSTKTEYVFESDKVKTTVTVAEDSDGNSEIKATTEITAKPTVSNGKKNISVDFDALSTALTQIDSAKAATGIEDLDRIITINVDDGKSVDEVSMNLTAEQTGRISRSSGTSLLIESELGKIEVGNDVFASNSSEGDMKLSLKKVSEIVNVPKELESMNNMTFFEANLSVGGSSVHQLGGTVKMSLPFALESGQDSKKVHVCYIDDEGKVEYINCTFDSETGLAVFETTHFSTFAVVYGDVQGSTPATQTITVSNSVDATMAVVTAVLAALVGAFGATTLMFILRAKGRF